MRTVVSGLHWLPVALCAALGAACTTTRVDESRVESAAVGSGEKVAVLGRRHNSEYETELEFMNSFYPWFEPRTAPMSLKRFQALLQMPAFAARMRELNLRYIVWIDGSTETVDKAGSISCAVGGMSGLSA